jgi:hypothetical protein
MLYCNILLFLKMKKIVPFSTLAWTTDSSKTIILQNHTITNNVETKYLINQELIRLSSQRTKMSFKKMKRRMIFGWLAMKKYPLNIKINKVFGTPVSRNLHCQGKNTVLSIITKNVLSRDCNHLDRQTTSTPPEQHLPSQIMFWTRILRYYIKKMFLS